MNTAANVQPAASRAAAGAALVRQIRFPTGSSRAARSVREQIAQVTDAPDGASRAVDFIPATVDGRDEYHHALPQEGIVSRAARLLGLGRTTLLEKMRKHEMG